MPYEERYLYLFWDEEERRSLIFVNCEPPRRMRKYEDGEECGYKDRYSETLLLSFYGDALEVSGHGDGFLDNGIYKYPPEIVKGFRLFFAPGERRSYRAEEKKQHPLPRPDFGRMLMSSESKLGTS